jgi:hypothetical protein
VLAKVLREMGGGVGLVSRAHLALREVQQHGGMLAQGIGLDERGPRLVVKLLIEILNALFEALARHGKSRVVVCAGRSGRKAHHREAQPDQQRPGSATEARAPLRMFRAHPRPSTLATAGS